MKQVTGKTKPSASENRVSIQLTLSGHSFSEGMLSELHNCDSDSSGATSAIVELCTAKTLFIPREAFDPSLAEAYLRIAGMSCAADETTVWSDPTQEIIAVMAVARKADELLRIHFKNVEYTCPINRIAPIESSVSEHQIQLLDIDGLIYIKVYDNQALQIVEVIPCDNVTEFACLLQRLNKQFPLRNFTATLSGERQATWKKEAKHYFAHIICA